MLGEKHLKILEVLGHGILSNIFPLGNVREFRYHPTSDFPFLLTFHLGTDGLKVPGPQVLDREELGRPWYTAPVVTRPCGTMYAVLLRG